MQSIGLDAPDVGAAFVITGGTSVETVGLAIVCFLAGFAAMLRFMRADGKADDDTPQSTALHRAPATQPMATLPTSERSELSALHRNAIAFHACRQCDGLDAMALIDACHGFANIVSQIPWTVASSAAREMMRNAAKVVVTHERQPRTHTMLSLAQLLEWEKAQGWHKPNGIIADRSAAMGLQWIRFGLQTWRNFFAAGPQSNQSQAARVFQEAAHASHGDRMGWLTRQSLASVTRKQLPWTAITTALGPSAEAAEQDVAIWCVEASRTIEELRRLQERYDMEDARKSI